MKKYLILTLLLGLYGTAMSQGLKVMSYNIHHGTDAAEQNNLEALGDFIKASGADLVGLQEVDSVCRRSGNVDQMKRLSEITGMYYVFARHYAYGGGAYGLGILSRYPISGMENNRLSLLKATSGRNSLALLSAVITLPGQAALVFATGHYALDTATRKLQAKETLAYLENKNLPVIFTGDLNAAPGTPEIAILEEFFSDADNRNLLTFPAGGAVKKIDYIFTAGTYFRRIKGYSTFPQILHSDHLPVMAHIFLKPGHPKRRPKRGSMF